MTIQNWQTVKNLLAGSQSVLVVFKSDSSGDILSSALALTLSLKQAGKEVQTVCPEDVPGRFSYLPGLNLVNKIFDPAGGVLVGDIAGAKNKLDGFWYENVNDGVKVFIALKEGERAKRGDVNIRVEGQAFDLIITLGLSSPENLGQFYGELAKVFFQSPSLNVDNNPENTNYGTVNLVDIVSSSVSEIILQLLENLSLPQDKDVATLLLSGIMGKTNSF